jgi:hypothetical protein
LHPGIALGGAFRTHLFGVVDRVRFTGVVAEFRVLLVGSEFYGWHGGFLAVVG